ncbi:MAG: hypothetical protein J6C03_07005 [Clostridia bacterium]|nr:hypothetical protein [Clostridia bacterium]
MIKKIILIFLSVLMMFSLVSCSSHSDEEIIEAAKELIEKSYVINEIYYGKGLPITDEDSLGFSSNYAIVDPSCGFATVEDIKKATAEVYASDYCEHLYVLAFEGLSTEDRESVSYARFMDDYTDKLTMLKEIKETGATLNRTYDFSTIVVEKCVRNMATIKIQSLVDGKEDKELTINLVYENDQWKLNTPTY